MLGIGLDGGNLAVGFGHKGLQLLLEQLVGCLGGGGLHRGPVGAATPIVVPGLEPTLLPGSAAAIAVSGSAGILTLGLGLQPLDGQVECGGVIPANTYDFSTG